MKQFITYAILYYLRLRRALLRWRIQEACALGGQAALTARDCAHDVRKYTAREIELSQRIGRIEGWLP